MPRIQGVASNGVKWLYAGDVMNNVRHGFGVCFWENGDRYEGEWKDDRTNGSGVYIQSNGARYDGEFKSHKMHGLGVCIYADGDRSEGEWSEGALVLQRYVPPTIIEFAQACASRARLSASPELGSALHAPMPQTSYQLRV